MCTQQHMITTTKEVGSKEKKKDQVNERELIREITSIFFFHLRDDCVAL